jgi:uncharacterized protein YegJ (DUF2314 family)
LHLAQDETTAPSAAEDSLPDAIEKARGSINQFFRAFRLPRRGQTDFRIQAVFVEGNHREYLWLSDIDFSTRPATGIVCDRPSIRSVAYRKRVGFRPEQMTDWMYRDNGRLVGGYTTKVVPVAETPRPGLLDQLKRRLIA